MLLEGFMHTNHTLPNSMLYNEKPPNKQRSASKEYKDHDTANTADSDDEGNRTPVRYLNPLEEYLNSSPLDHGPPELSTLSERYGDPSSPSQRTPGAKARQKVIVQRNIQYPAISITMPIYYSLLLHHHYKNMKRQDSLELKS